MIFYVFIIFIIVLQQVDGNIIGPLVLSDSTGLSSFWILFAILVGGNLFGFIGMIIGVPTFAVIYATIKSWVYINLVKKNLPTETKAFDNLECIDQKGFQFKEQKLSKNASDSSPKYQSGDQYICSVEEWKEKKNKIDRGSQK